MEKDKGKEILPDGMKRSVKISGGTIEQIGQQWEHLGICNDFIFCKVMLDEELLAELVHLILPDVKFTKLVVHAQKAVEEGMDIHGVRFDVFAMDETGRVIEVEMQVLDTGHLPRRLRFYGSMADMEQLDKGVVYSRLKDQYVIMICPFDLYGKGLHRYTFVNACKEDKDLEMGDGTTKIVLNAAGTSDDVHGTLREFLDYVAGKPSCNPFVEKIDDAVRKARANKEWRREYMTLMMRDLENKELGREEGRKEGREEGREEGRKEGREEGREEEQKDRIAQMLRKGKSPEDIADFCGYPLNLVLNVQSNMTGVQQAAVL